MNVKKSGKKLLCKIQSSSAYACARFLRVPSLLNLTIEKASEGLESGLFTSADLVKAYLARIEEASEFNAVLQVNPDALNAARSLDDERTRSGSRGFVLNPPSSDNHLR